MPGSFTSVPPFDSSIAIPEQQTPNLPALASFTSDNFETPSVQTDSDSLSYSTLFNANDFSYTDYEIDGRYDTDNGLLIIPVAGPPGTAAEVVRVHAPYTTKSVKWTAERGGTPPTLPSANTGVANEMLAHKTVFGIAPGIDLFGTAHIYRNSGEYFYLMPVPKADTDPLVFGKLPYDITPSVSSPVLSSQFDLTILQSL